MSIRVVKFRKRGVVGDSGVDVVGIHVVITVGDDGGDCVTVVGAGGAGRDDVVDVVVLVVILKSM